MKNTKIPWTDHTVNLWWGCSPVSEACQNCYAAAMAKRFGKDCFGDKPRWDKRESAYAEAKRLNRSAERRGVHEVVFINSMSDFFDDKVPFQWRWEFYPFADSCKNLDFLLLTKRPWEIGLSDAEAICDIENIHLGITAENQRRLDERMWVLEDFKGQIFLSCEPLLEAIDITPYKDRIDWVICGGESGSKAREFKHLWVMSLFNQCKGRIPFFFKQAGANSNMCPECIGEWEQVRRYPEWHPNHRRATK